MARDDEIIAVADGALPGAESTLDSQVVSVGLPDSAPNQRVKLEVGVPLNSYDSPVTILIVKRYKSRFVGSELRVGDLVFISDHFIIEQMAEVDREKINPMYTFGNAVVYTNGRTHRVYSYAGSLVDNTEDGSSIQQWWQTYEKFMRGSRCVDAGLEIEMQYRDRLRRGLMLQTNMSRQGIDQNRATFGFSMLVNSTDRL